ncbi:histone-lysine N-methyltransferase 2C-like [Arapaima gigas]
MSMKADSQGDSRSQISRFKRMSSEDRSAEASEEKPSPVASSGGASPADSPTPADRRPRGRPRKDAIAAAAAAATATPATTPKPKKKPRNRGKAVGDDDDSMDGTEAPEGEGPLEADAKEQQEEGGGAQPEEEPREPLVLVLIPSQSTELEAWVEPAASGAMGSEQLCSLCHCGGRSLLGQGELRRFGPVSRYVPQDILNQNKSPDRAVHHDCSPGPNSTEYRQKRSPSGARSCLVEEPSNKFWDELGQVGLPDDIDVQSLFSEAGYFYAHEHCAVWSQGVSQGEDQSLLNVGQAIHSGSTTHCAYCKRLGATVKCCEETCRHSYHYPCAAAAGTFQDIRSLTLLCPTHIQQAVDRSTEQASCAVCDSPGDLLDQLFCTSCGQHYHGVCLDVAPTPLKRAGWQCPECKVCQTCKNPGEDSKMLVCDMCDKGYHTFCLQPVMDSIPTNGWRCKNCRMCVECGTRSSGQWHHNNLLCDSCYQHQDPVTSCFLCGNAINLELHKDLLSCHMCKRWLHLECEQQADGDAEAQSREQYVCAECKQTELETDQKDESEALKMPRPDTEPVPGSTKSQPMFDHLYLLCGVSCALPGASPISEVPEVPGLNMMEAPKSLLRSSTDVAAATIELAPPMEAEKVDPELQLSKAAELANADIPATELEAEVPSEEAETMLRTEAPEEASALPLKEAIVEAAAAIREVEEEPMEVSHQEHSRMDSTARSSTLGIRQEELTVGMTHVSPAHIFQALSATDLSPLVTNAGSADVNSTGASESTFSDFSSPPEHRIPKPSPTDPLESPPKQAGSPISSRALPQELALGLPPPVPQEHGSIVPSSTFIPVAPKIGMGKPAISKRKFSPGRPKAKQGAWSTYNGVSSSSWSTYHSDGWDAPEMRRPLNSLAWSIKVGRGSGFPGKRRPRGSGLSGRGGRGRSKTKNTVSPVVTPGVNLVEMQYAVKEEEENAMHNTVVLFSSSDTFTLKQDMCVVCGSFGLGAEGRLLACAQCGQCYHPFCVNIKITKVVLSKGWRCLECTVCEACGQASDPGRLLLCDDCDISYHTYCLDPPLQTVPKGSWKCRWCVTCTQCGSTSPGLRCEWQNNYTQCAPCGSLTVCPLCTRSYCEDELIVQCRQCDRWMHASCVCLNSEEEVEAAADSGFDCTMCKAQTTPSQVPVPSMTMTMCTEEVEPPAMTQIMTKIKELDPGRTYTQDGVCLTESGLSQLQSLAARGGRRRRPKPKLKLKIINQNSVAVLQAPPDPHSEYLHDGDAEESRAEGDPLDCDGKSDSSPEREIIDEDTKGLDGPNSTKKRKRKPYRPGIGGFMVRQRSRTGQGKAKRSLSRKDSSGSVSENMLGKDEGWMEMPETPVEETATGSEGLEKAKKRYRKKRTKLEEEFPSYLQEAFFGKELLDRSRQNRPALESVLSDDDHTLADGKAINPSFPKPSSDLLPSAAAKSIPPKATAQPNPEDPLLDLSEVLNTDSDILGILSGDLEKTSEDSVPVGLDLSPFQVKSPTSPFACLGIGPLADISVATSQPPPGRGPRTLPEEPLDGILSPELDKMVTDVLTALSSSAELEGKDVEDLFTAVLSPSTSHPPPLASHALPTSGTVANPGGGVFPRMPMMNGLMGQNPNFPPVTMTPSRGSCGPNTFSPIHRMPLPDHMRDKKFGQVQREQMVVWSTLGPAAPAETEMDTMSNAQRNTLKWEKEETLGEAATVAPVLYTNVNFPNLKEEFPDWSTRVKQIAKLWRKASSQERAPYVQKARDNRAALRINKVQMSNESIKRQQHHQQQPPAEVFDPAVTLDTDLLFKDPLKHKESEHEQEWKLRQQMRQKSKQQAKIEATQKLEQVKSEQQQLQQQQLGSHSEGDTPSSGSQSPMTSQSTNGSMSPMQQMLPKYGFPRPQLPGMPTSGTPDDVFLRPPPPPPAGTRMPTQDGNVCLPQGSSSQPQSPQRFSPGCTNSRPSSPWDPYAKMIGTPRPPPLGSTTPRRNSLEAGKSPRSEQLERAKPSPVPESFGSPTSLNDPYAKPPDTPRPAVTADPFVKPMEPPKANSVSEQQGRHLIGSPGGNNFARPAHRSEVYHRMPLNRMILSDPYSRPLLTPIPGSNESGSVPLFKAPMPPHQSQDSYTSTHSTLRPLYSDGFSQNQPHDPYAQPSLAPRPSVNENFSHPPRMVRHPQGNPFTQSGSMARLPSRDLSAHTPSNSRQDYSQSIHDPYAQTPGTPCPSSDPYAKPPGTPHPSTEPYVQPPSTPQPSPDPYAQPPNTPRPSSDPYTQPAATPRPTADPYAQPPGTPRPSTETYVQPPSTAQPSPDPFSQPPGTPRPLSNPRHIGEQHPQQPQPQLPSRRQSPSHSVDPYAQPPGTPRPVMGERFPKSPGSQRTSDPFVHPSRNPRLINSDPFSQPPGTPRPVLNDPYTQPPGTPLPGTGNEMLNRLVSRPFSSQDLFSPSQGRLPDSFTRQGAPGSQTPKNTGFSDGGFTSPRSNQTQPNQTPLHDPFDQAPVTSQSRPNERFSHELKDQQGVGHEVNSHDLGQFSDIPQNSGTAPDAHSGVHQVLDDTEEKLKQRQRIRELIRRQQQQKCALRQEKGLQESTVTTMPGTPCHWSQENSSQPNEIFGKPPPPYPGSVKASWRFPGPFPADQQANFPSEGQFNKPQFQGDTNITGLRPHGQRFGFPTGGQAQRGSQEHFFKPHQMPEPMMNVPPQMRRSMSVDLARAMGNNQMGLPQHFPPRGMQVQQHSIMGQPYIELRHRAPENRLRFPLGSSPMTRNVVEPSTATQGPTVFMTGQDVGLSASQGPRMVDPMINQKPGMASHRSMSSSMENLHQHPMPLCTVPQHPPLMRSLSHPASTEALNINSSILLTASTEQTEDIPIANPDGIEEKPDTDDSAVKDLEDVEVKDLVDEDLENLNLDPEDGKDLDLETNDLHLDDFLTSGKFDIIAYTDPELDLEDKKDMFNEELDLSDPIDDSGEPSDLQKVLPEKKNTSSSTAGLSSQANTESGINNPEKISEHSLANVKQERTADQSVHTLCTETMIKTELTETAEGSSATTDQLSAGVAHKQEGLGNGSRLMEVPLHQPSQPSASAPSSSTPTLSRLLVKEKPVDSVLGPMSSPSQGDLTVQVNQVAGIQQGLNVMMRPGQITEQAMNPTLNVSHLISPTEGLPPESLNVEQNQPLCQSFGADPPLDPVLPLENPQLPNNLAQTQQAVFSQGLGQQNQQSRPLLLEEQPLLLQDLLDQERQEQQQQRQMQAMIRQRSNDSFFPNVDLDGITDPIMKAKMVALKGINKVMVQNNLGMAPVVMNRFPFSVQQLAGPQCPEAAAVSQQTVVQDGKLTTHTVRPNPPHFGPGFPMTHTDTQKKQYEDWLQETQQLLQIQQKFLEEQIGAHRKSKKALSAKQRTAKKAGRQFPEEDAEQLKHVTEQQGVVQKQLEQIRKQQKEHAELIEEYRVKQQQHCAMQNPMIMVSGCPPVMQGQLQPVLPSNTPHMPPMHNWHTGNPRPMIGPWLPPHLPHQGTAANPTQQAAPHPETAATAASGDSPHVKFDDNNPFSEGFQERERKERLREQQERQRVQLLQEVGRQRALQQRIELERQGGPHGFVPPTGPQQTLGHMFPQEPNIQSHFMGPPSAGHLQQGGEHQSMVSNETFGPTFRPNNPAMPGSNFLQGQPRLPKFGAPGRIPQGTGESSSYGIESAMPLPPNYPGSGPSLIQLYSNIIPEEKGKKKRNQKKKKEEDVELVRTPSTPQSDLTAPLTPSVSDTASTPTRSMMPSVEPDLSEHPMGSFTPNSLSGQTSSEMELRLSDIGGGTSDSVLNITSEATLKDEQNIVLRTIKLERIDVSECHSTGHNDELATGTRMVKVEEGPERAAAQPVGQSPAQSSKGDTGNELLKHLLKNKSTPPLLPHQMSSDGSTPEEGRAEDSKVVQRHNSVDSTGTVAEAKLLPALPEGHGPALSEQDRKKQRNKRAPKALEKATPRSKKRKKEEDERQASFASTDTLMNQLKQQLSLLPLVEPLIGISFTHFPPYGSGQLDGESQLSGSFGSASLGGVSDYYSQLICKQDNLSNPPTPPASLPPTPPPLARQKMVNGFATTEELAAKAAVIGGLAKELGPKHFQAPYRPEEELLARAIAQGPKTVDVPASLPTPPHNNHEDLRSQEPCDDQNTPDSFIPSSSPESVVGIEVSRYPDLSRVKEEPPSPSLSPIIPMLPSTNGKGTKQQELKMEPSGMFFGSQTGQASKDSKAGLVSIAITLNPAAAENITSVVAAVAGLLCVKIPSSYEVTGGPEWGPLALMGGLKVPPRGFETRGPSLSQGPGSGPLSVTQLQNPSGARGGPQHQLHFPTISTGQAAFRDSTSANNESPEVKPQWCCHCKVVILGNGVRKPTKDFPSLKQDSKARAQSTAVFCSHSCFVLYSSARQPIVAATQAKEAAALLSDSVPKDSLSKTLHQYSNNMSTLDVHCLPHLQPKVSPSTTPPLTFPSASPDFEAKPDALKVTVKLKPRPRTVHNSADVPLLYSKRWKGLRWRKWSLHIAIPRENPQLPAEDEVDELLQKLGTSLRPETMPRDHRRCCFCHEEGDGLTDGPARLLNLDLDLWVHLNCALWSTEVYETQAGALINVELALRRGLSVRCAYCQRTGATSGCHRFRCANVYHFTCALKAQCMFFKDKTMLCHTHRPRGSSAHEHELRYFAVFRRVYVQRDEVQQLASLVRRGERDHTFRVGSLVLHTVGQLLPQQMAAFHSPTAIFLFGYEATRIYWSMRHSNRRCCYLCSIDEKDGQPEFRIRVVEQGYEDLVLTDRTPKGVWDKVLDPVAERRSESSMLKLFPIYLKGEDLFGLTVSAVMRIAESLPGVEACENYTFRYGRNPLMHLPLAVNPSGCARSEPRTSLLVPRPHTLTSSRTSKCYQGPISNEPGAPYSKHFVHSKSSQYRRMKAEWKSSVFLARSRIQGLGLYAARDIEKYTMVIEYVGTILRNAVAARKEKMYESQNRGVYMFRIDSEHVIDATLRGGPARYINHSCAPNCVAEVVTFERGHKIIISSIRKIQKGEELCYDYKFDLEDDQHKVPCHCGAVNCRKWMN